MVALQPEANLPDYALIVFRCKLQCHMEKRSPK
jgi:hypothetical protein